MSRDGTVADACLRLAGLRRSHPAGRVQSRRYWTVVVLLVRNCQCDRDSVALRLIKFYLYTILRLVSIKFYIILRGISLFLLVGAYNIVKRVAAPYICVFYLFILHVP